MESNFWTKERIRNRILSNFKSTITSVENDNLSEIIYPQDFFKFEGEDFIREVYVSILDREPDENGLKQNLYLLKTGFPKSFILYHIISSREAKFHVKNKRIAELNKLKIKYFTYLLLSPIIKLSFIQKLHKRLRSIYRYYRLKRYYE